MATSKHLNQENVCNNSFNNNTRNNMFKTPTCNKTSFQTLLSYSNFMKKFAENDNESERKPNNRMAMSQLSSSCDRFIPNRRLSDNDLSNFLLYYKKKNFKVNSTRQLQQTEQQRALLTDVNPQSRQEFHQRVSPNWSLNNEVSL